MLRRLLLTAAASATAALSAVPSASAGTPAVLPAVPAGTQVAAPTPPAVSLLPVASRAPLAAFAGLSPLYAAARGVALPGAMPPPARPEDSEDRLTVTVHDAGAGVDGTYELDCHPAGGSHPRAAQACDRLDANTTWGKDPFAPVSPDALCTMQYGGPATAHVTGTWAGRPVDARYDRTNGCEISRWNAMVPVLPDARSE
ncbi:SSI family serine proteinase inhibitor [Streptomyces sp. NPDC007084]|uniref:SSI family serine proteinase inhibitor n=1 Tax=Streptomyces sp. NPDC007084 TaxID=3154313 RepID=UPI00345687DB